MPHHRKGNGPDRHDAGEISKEKLWDIIKRCELTEDEERQVQAHCAKQGVIYLSTPFSREAADRLDAMGVPAFKIGSGECNNLPLLDHIAQFGKPMIMSTGMNDLASVKRSVAVFEGGVPLCAACIAPACIRRHMTRFGSARSPICMQAFPGMPIGLSDHSMNIWTCLGAVALGASLLEKHFTISRTWPGPDTGISIEPDELHDLIEGSRASGRRGAGARTPAGRAAGDRLCLCDRRLHRADQGRRKILAGECLGEAAGHRPAQSRSIQRRDGQSRDAQYRERTAYHSG